MLIETKKLVQQIVFFENRSSSLKAWRKEHARVERRDIKSTREVGKCSEFLAFFKA